MNLTSMSGGLMLAALAGVWFLMFLPSWMSRTSEREKNREDLAVAKQSQAEVVAKLSSSEQQRVAKSANKAMLIKRGTLFVGLPAIAVLSWTLAILATNPEVLVWAVASALVAVASIILNRAAHRAYLGALDSSRVIRSKAAQRRANVALPDRTRQPSSSENAAETRDPRAWSAPGVPRPLYRGSEGAIEQVSFAEVIEINTAAADESAVEAEQFLGGAALDEILKRRRANG
jgi:hypothetical protein